MNTSYYQSSPYHALKRSLIYKFIFEVESHFFFLQKCVLVPQPLTKAYFSHHAAEL